MLVAITTTSTVRRTYVFERKRLPTISEAINLLDSERFHDRADVMVDVDELDGEEFRDVYEFVPATKEVPRG